MELTKIFLFPAEQSSLKEKQIQQNIFFVDIFFLREIIETLPF